MIVARKSHFCLTLTVEEHVLTFRFVKFIDTSVSTLFTVYSDTGDDQLAVSLGKDTILFLQDEETKPQTQNVVSFGVGINDGK